MRKCEYLSPTSLNKFKKSPREFYRDYLADTRAPRTAQTGAMAVGSAFDAFVKSQLMEKLYGEASGKYTFDALFEKQVEPARRDQALLDGRHCFESYVRSGAFADLLVEMLQSSRPPRFEFTSQGSVTGSDGNNGTLSTVGGVPFLGKPDAEFTDTGSNNIILDWKVNGYYSKSPVSPYKGYVICRDGWDLKDFVNSRSHGRSHDDFVGSSGRGLRYNTKLNLEDVNEDWATQVAIYAWLAGKKVGEHFLCCIEQLCCDTTKGTKAPLIRVATHRCPVSAKYQQETYRFAVGVWEIIKSGWIFRDLTEDQSRELQEVMDRGVVDDEDTAFLKANLKQTYR